MLPETLGVSVAEVAPVVAPDLPLIEGRELGKVYHLYNRPQDRLKQAFLWGRKKLFRDFWALHNVSFELRRGQMLGIIGRNGSGKSTLLQILAGVLQPTTGSLVVRGRVAALLELGSGFNPEYTGRENVYLNGAILGISRGEMEKRFDQIAEFAEIGQFIDQPVKTYSSGMFVRLAFAVTTCVDADVLLIDEALAVGDVFFRQKCYQRLESIRKGGTAIILVSHAMADVEQFCGRCILLHRGHDVFQGSGNEAVKRYYLIEQEERAAAAGVGRGEPAVVEPRQAESLHHNTPHAMHWPGPEAFVALPATQVSNGWARCTAVAMCDSEGRARRNFEQGQTVRFYYEFEILRDIEVPIGGVVLRDARSVAVHGKNALQFELDTPAALKAGQRIRFRQQVSLEIRPEEYTLEVGLATMSRYDFERRALYSNDELNTKVVRLCHVPGATSLRVGYRTAGGPIQLMSHGIANLPGSCEMAVV